MSAPIRVGLIGAGHWGPNLARNVAAHPRARLVAVCDRNQERLDRVADVHAGAFSTTEAAEVLEAPDVDAVVIATPTATHHGLARAALLAGKHVLVEKPIAACSEHAEELDRLAAERGLTLLVGHVFLYHGAVRHVRDLIATNALGDLHYLHSRRTNLGPVRDDVHAAWDLAAHDISIFLYLLDDAVAEVTAAAQTCIRPGVPDVVFATLFFARGTVAHLHTSWLDPQKVRELTVVGSQRMAVFDDLDLTGPVRIFDKGIRTNGGNDGAALGGLDAFQVELVQGDVRIPRVVVGEPLRKELEAFLDAIETGVRPLADGRLGTAVVRVLEALDRSLANGSVRTQVQRAP